MWDKNNRKYAKLCWLTNENLTFNIEELPIIIQWKTKFKSFSMNFPCFAKKPILFESLISGNINLYVNNNSFISTFLLKTHDIEVFNNSNLKNQTMSKQRP